jgi:hypothetical protein
MPPLPLQHLCPDWFHPDPQRPSSRSEQSRVVAAKRDAFATIISLRQLLSAPQWKIAIRDFAKLDLESC